MWAAKSLEYSLIVELGGFWWWRVDELPDQFWEDLVAGFKKFWQNPQDNTFSDSAELIAHFVKMSGGFQPELVK